MNPQAATGIERPSVSVVVPFLGDAEAAGQLVAELGRLRLRGGDELIVADNTRAGTVKASGPIRVVHAPERRSAYFARNAGARAASAAWLLFTDADCELPADLLDRMLGGELDPDCAVIAGEAVGVCEQRALLARWARSRRGLITSHHIDGGPAPAGGTANLAIRRDAFEAAGGFEGDVRSDADIDLCWRVQARGGTFAYRPDVRVGHRDPERLSAVVRQAKGYGAGRRWLRRRHGDEVEGLPLVAPLLRSVAGAVSWAVRLRGERAVFKLVDGVVAAAAWWGWRFGDNRAG
jgi:glycosyltransferase involved in cell wall biosynthesis